MKAALVFANLVTVGYLGEGIWGSIYQRVLGILE